MHTYIFLHRYCMVEAPAQSRRRVVKEFWMNNIAPGFVKDLAYLAPGAGVFCSISFAIFLASAAISRIWPVGLI